MISRRATHANALLLAGDRKKAADLFADAERRQQELQPQYPLLYSVRGYQYCDLFLSKGQAGEARDRAARTLEWGQSQAWMLGVALETLVFGRSCLALALQILACSADVKGTDARAARARLEEAVEGLRASGRNDFVASGLLARAAFSRVVGEWEGATRDLDEAKEIAEPGLMRLFLCDVRARTARGLRWRGARPSRRSTASSSRARRRPSCRGPTKPRGSRKKRARSSTSRASSLPNAATIAATKNWPNSTLSWAATVTSPTCRLEFEAAIAIA